jgi:hypothetical protein
MDDVKDEHITPVGLAANGHNVADYERAHVGHMKGEHVNIMEKEAGCEENPILLHDSNDMDDVKLEDTPPREPSFNGDNVPNKKRKRTLDVKDEEVIIDSIEAPSKRGRRHYTKAWILVTRLQSLATKRENVFST